VSGIEVVVFDVNETLSDLAPMNQRFADVGAPELLAKVWFASLLRDGFALTAAGSSAHFADLADGALRTVLAGASLNRDMDSAICHVLDGFAELDLHIDIPEGVRALRTSGLRLVTLTNGSTDVAERLLASAGIHSEFEQLISVDSAGVWKPAPGSYRHAAEICGVPLDQMLLVAVHPWDIDGASRAGMRTGWINRSGVPYPSYFIPPEFTVSALTELVGCLGRRG
jgi:2-haloacid dehalogenase